MTTLPRLPRPLTAVAYLQLFIGITSLGFVVVAALQERISVDFQLLGIPIAIGLLRLNRTWRAFCVTLLSIGLFFGTLFTLVALVGQIPDCIDFYWVKARTVPPLWIAAYTLPLLVLDSWQVRVLLRPDVTRLFVGERGGPAGAVEASHG